MEKPGSLREIDKAFLLRWFEHRMTAEDRQALMRELPEAYNRWVGEQIAIVTLTVRS